MSFDSVNYHVFSGSRVWDFWKFLEVEFYPAGIHSFPPIFDYLGGIFRTLLGYRLGSICSLLFLYGIIILLFKISNLLLRQKISSNILMVLFFINTFISLEAFFQIGTYYVDIIGAFFVLWSLYLWFLYQKTGLNKFLYLSSLLMGVAVAGKLTNLIYAIPLFFIIAFLECQKRQKIKLKVKKILIFFLLLLLPISVSCIDNFVKTGSPLFPFYNSIFRSKYFPPISFENTNYGGTSLIEKILWPINSLSNVGRLGEGHDLYNDFKLSLYFVLLIPSLFLSFKLRKKNILFWYFNLYFLLSMMVWNLTFGYLRYAYVLEMLGGLMVLVWVSKMISVKDYKFRRLIVIPVIILLLIFGYLDKRAININLAYDVSWRQTYFYNRVDYIKEFKNLFVNKVDFVPVSEENVPDIYLNCSSPGLSFYSLSQFNGLPVVNIDARASVDMTSNKNYVAEVNRRVNIALNGKKPIKFVTIVGNHGLSNQYRDCTDTLKIKNYTINEQVSVDNFLGFQGQKLVYIFGEY